MSRVGKMPIKVPEKVKVAISADVLKVEGPLGKLEVALDPLISVKNENGVLIVSRKDESIAARSRHGLMRNLIRNAVDGVNQGYKKDLDINGVGFRAEVKGPLLVLTLGYSHPVEFPIPAGIKVAVEKQTHLTITGFAKALVGETAAKIRKLRLPEPYKGKGIKYTEEFIKKKVGKSAVASGGK